MSSQPQLPEVIDQLASLSFALADTLAKIAPDETKAQLARTIHSAAQRNGDDRMLQEIFQKVFPGESVPDMNSTVAALSKRR